MCLRMTNFDQRDGVTADFNGDYTYAGDNGNHYYTNIDSGTTYYIQHNPSLNSGSGGVWTIHDQTFNTFSPDGICFNANLTSCVGTGKWATAPVSGSTYMYTYDENSNLAYCSNTTTTTSTQSPVESPTKARVPVPTKLPTFILSNYDLCSSYKDCESCLESTDTHDEDGYVSCEWVMDSGGDFCHNWHGETVKNQSQCPNSRGLIAGITLGIIVFIVLLVVSIGCYMRRRRKTRNKREHDISSVSQFNRIDKTPPKIIYVQVPQNIEQPGAQPKYQDILPDAQPLYISSSEGQVTAQ